MPQRDLVGCHVSFDKLSLKQSLTLDFIKTYVNSANEYSDEDSEGIIERTVDDLEPDTTYRFDLLAQPLRVNSQELPYRTVWVKTRAFC